MVDTDISHAVEARLAAIETRLDELEGGTPASLSVDEEVEPEEELE